MDKPKKTYNVFFDPYRGAGGVVRANIPDEVMPDLPWRYPAVGEMDEMSGELVGIPLARMVVHNGSSRGSVGSSHGSSHGKYADIEKRKAYRREYMRLKRLK